MLVGKAVSVGTTAVDLLSGVDLDKDVEVQIRTKSLGVDVFVGNSSVTATDGFLLLRDGDLIKIRSSGGEHPYAVTNGGTGTVYVLAARI